MIWTDDSTIVVIYGLYAATVKDAKIMEDVFENDVNLRELIQPDDNLIAEWCFRDCIKVVKRDLKLKW